MNIYPTINKGSELTDKQEFDEANKIYPTIKKTLPEPETSPVQLNPTTPAPTTPIQIKPNTLNSYVPEGMDAEAVLLAKAIRQHESGNVAQIPGEGSEVGGASLYQYTHGTWKSTAQKYLGDANAPMTRENENKATYLKILDWKKKGYNPAQIASMWNAGEGRPNAYKENWKGINKWGVAYDTPAYVEKVYATYKQLKGEYKPEVKTNTNEQQYIDTAGAVDKSKTVDELKNQYQQIKNVRNELIVKTSVYADKKKVQELFDSGKLEELDTYLTESLANYSKEQKKSRTWYQKGADVINKVYEAYTQLPIVKQAGQAVGAVVGSLGALESALITAVGQPILNKAKGEKFTEDWWKSIKEATKEGYKFGSEIGKQGTYVAPLGGLGKVPLAVMDVAQVISGGESLGEAIETGDQQKAIEAGTSLAMPFLAPTLAGIKTKGFTKMGDYSVLDAMFGKGTFIDPEVKNFTKTQLQKTKVVQNIQAKRTKTILDKGVNAYNKLLNLTPTQKTDLAKKYGSTDPISRTLIEEEIPLKVDENRRYQTVEQADTLREKTKVPNDLLNSLLEENPLKRNNLEQLRTEAKEKISQKQKSAFEVEETIKEIDEIIDAEIKRYGELVNDKQFNTIKQGLWNMSYNNNRPNMNSTARQLGSIIKEKIVKNNPEKNIQALNDYIGRLSETAYLIEKMNGKTIPAAGLFSKRIAQAVGAVAGTPIPVLGNIAGYQIAGKIFDAIHSPEKITTSKLNSLRKLGFIPEYVKTLEQAKQYLIDLKINPKKILQLGSPTAIYGQEWKGGQSGIVNEQPKVNIEASQKATGIYKKPLQLEAPKGSETNPIILPEAKQTKKEQVKANIEAKKSLKEIEPEKIPDVKSDFVAPERGYNFDGSDVYGINSYDVKPGKKIYDDNYETGGDGYLVITEKLDDKRFRAVNEEDFNKKLGIENNKNSYGSYISKKNIEKLKGLVMEFDIFGNHYKIKDITSNKPGFIKPDEFIPKKEQVKANIEAKKIIDPKKPTTKILNELNGKTSVKKQFIEDLTRKPDISKIEKEIISEALKTEGDIINTKQFVQKVQNELLPLNIYKIKKSEHRYENVSLEDDLRGKIDYYSEHIYESPIKTSAGDVHFRNQTKNYFGHTRVEDIDLKDLRRVIEVQSDLYQRGRLENEFSQEARGKSGAKMNFNTIEERVAYQKELKKQGEKLKQYNDPTAHFRMVREEIKQASIDGKKKLQFPTGKTAMGIEGLADLTNTYSPFYIKDLNYLQAKPENIKVGQTLENVFTDQYLVITDILGDGKFKAVSENSKLQAIEEFDYRNSIEEGGNGELFSQLSKKEQDDYLKNHMSVYEEQFDISGKVDTNNPIYKFYQETLGKYLKNKYNAKEITDSKGVKWYEIDIDEKMKDEPVLAFGLTDIKTLLTTSGIMGTSALIASLIASKKEKESSNTNEPKEVNQTAQANLEPKKDINAIIEDYIKTIKVEINGTGSNLGNTLAKDNNNPGNLIFAGQPNAVKGKGGFAKFPTPELGFRALVKQVQADQRRNLSLRDFITKYAPPTENNTEKYIKDVSSELGIEESKNIAELDPIELAKKMAKFESNTTITE